MGQSPDGSTYSDVPSDYILVQGNADLKDGWVNPRMWTTQKTKTAQAGDLIMSVRAPAGAMGKTVFDAVIGRGVAAIKGNEFIYQLLVKMDSEGYWKSLSCGSTFESLNSQNILNAEITIPDIEEQKLIGEYFENLDYLITLHQRKYNMHDIYISRINKIIFQKRSLFMAFTSEAEFEEALVNYLTNNGIWEKNIIKHPTEKDLIRNWANILFENNRGIDRLNNYPLTDGEMQQIIEQINMKRTPLKLNGFINGRTVSITRDNPEDELHFGKEISLKIYDRREIAAGQSRYQIVEQPEFAKKNKLLNNRRGDLMLLINGMPVIHIELKKSGVPVSQACEQIKKYAYEGVFTGLFSLVQVFVAMNPEETLYFANPGPDGKFNSDYYFHWADFDNEPINDWMTIASTLLSIPMAHQLIGFYTVADEADGVLKVMRSYQYFAASAIADKVSKTKWGEDNQLGGYIWHTTGS